MTTDSSPKDYYDAAKRNDNDRKIMQIPLFLGAIAIFYVSGKLSQLLTARVHSQTTDTPICPTVKTRTMVTERSAR